MCVSVLWSVATCQSRASFKHNIYIQRALISNYHEIGIFYIWLWDHQSCVCPGVIVVVTWDFLSLKSLAPLSNKVLSEHYQVSMLCWCYLLNYDPNIETFSDPLSFPLGGGPGLYINEDFHSNFLWNTTVNSLTSAPLFLFTLRIEGIWLYSLLNVTDSWLLLTSAYPGYPLEIAPSVFGRIRWVVWNLWDKPKSQLNVGFTSVSVWPITQNQWSSLVIGINIHTVCILFVYCIHI